MEKNFIDMTNELSENDKQIVKFQEDNEKIDKLIVDLTFEIDTVEKQVSAFNSRISSAKDTLKVNIRFPVFDRQNMDEKIIESIDVLNMLVRQVKDQ